ncbi:MAG: MAPEG family protein [Hyphomicrobiales bacterium]
MTTDLTMLAWTAAFTSLLWIPYILARIQKAGVMETLTYVADDEPLPGWAQRAKRAHYNAIESLVPFAAVVIVAHLTASANATTAVWATVFFWARVAHYIGHISGLPFVRTTFFAVGWLAILVIFLQIVV